MIDIAYVVMLILASMQPKNSALNAAMIFTITSAFHGFFCRDFDGFLYYGSAAFLAMFVTIVLSMFKEKCALGRKIQLISLTSIVLNIMGYWLWHFYFDPAVYDFCFALLYAYSCWAFLDHGRRNCEVGSWDAGNDCNARPCSFGLSKRENRA